MKVSMNDNTKDNIEFIQNTTFLIKIYILDKMHLENE